MTISPQNEVIVVGGMKNLANWRLILGFVESVKQGKLTESGAMVAKIVVDISEVKSDMVTMRTFTPTLESITVNEGVCTEISLAVSCEKMDVQDSSK